MPANVKISAFIAASLDGFIARPDGGIDWLTDTTYELPNEDFGYQTFMNTVDVLVMGRHTYEKVLLFGEWPYGNKPVIVLTHAQPRIPDELKGRIEMQALSPSELIDYVTERGIRHVYLDGGQTIQSFLREGLVDEITLTQIPVLLGQGIPLFGEIPGDIRLQHIQTSTFANGFVQSIYKPVTT